MDISYRCRSGIKTDRFPKRVPRAQVSIGVQGLPFPGKFFGTKLKFPSHLSKVSKTFRQDIGYILTWKVFFFSLKIYLFMKNFTDFRKTVETRVDPSLN